LAVVLLAAAGAQDISLVPPDYLAPKYIAPSDAPSSIVIAGPDEPGERLVVTGRVIDGTKPVASASIFLFHTDVKGRYAPGVTGPDAELNPRLRGLLRTDGQGGYRYETVRPGSYDGNAAHVHYIVVARGYSRASSTCGSRMIRFSSHAARPGNRKFLSRCAIVLTIRRLRTTSPFGR
jgi:protocatechuate 3,4-dioxygenase beta subunit